MSSDGLALSRPGLTPPHQVEQEEEEEEEAFCMYVFADFWYDFFLGITSSAVCGSSGASLPIHCVWTSGFYSTVPIPHWIVLFSWSLW